MDLVTHDATVMLEQDQAQSLLLEMAAVVRTIFAVHRPEPTVRPATQPTVQPVVQPAVQDTPIAAVATAETAAFPGASVSAVATSPAPAPALAVPPPLPVPALSLPVPGLDVGDPEERHSMALLQEIAFLDE